MTALPPDPGLPPLVLAQWRLQIRYIAQVFKARMALIVAGEGPRASVVCAERGRLRAIPPPKTVPFPVQDQPIHNGRMMIGHRPIQSRFWSQPIHSADGQVTAMLVVVSPLIKSPAMVESCCFLLEEALRLGTRVPVGAAEEPAPTPVRWEVFRPVVEAQMGAEPLALISADVDNLSELTARYGDKAARAALAAIARRIAACVEGRGLICPIEEGRFLLLLREADSIQTMAAFAQQVLQTGMEIPVGPGETAHAVLSLGIAPYRPGVRDYDQLERQAHAAMYQARRFGGDRFVVFSDTMQDIPPP